jgi:uncharacterized protein (TIGR02145 family)
MPTTTLGTYNLSATQNGVTFTGSGTFTTLGCQLITLTASGTPTAAGPFTWCTNTTPQGCSPATVATAEPQTYTCGGSTTLVVDVTNPTTGKTWMDRNLGASQVATSSTNVASYGDLFQWGRACDGHQKRTSLTTSTNATTAVPNAGNTWDGRFITETTFPIDWLTPQDSSLWKGVSGTNNPCPSGYRLPTQFEWEDEIASWSSNDAAGAFASPLKLPSAGFRSSGFATIGSASSSYWSSTVAGTGINSVALNFSSNSPSMDNYARAMGHTVRCIKN